MSDAVEIDGKEYISSKRASELCGYSQDYIGQLSRGGLIDAKRISGLWYVSFPSLESHKAHAESYKPTLPTRVQESEPDSLLSFDGKDYVSAGRASKITGYHQDYVGQLARSGAILSRQVGNRWYVERDGILAHKEEKDGLLAAVQTESVGIVRRGAPAAFTEPTEDMEPQFTYTKESLDPIPTVDAKSGWREFEEQDADVEEEYRVPIRVVEEEEPLIPVRAKDPTKSRRAIHGKTIFYGAVGTAVLTIVLLVSFGISKLDTSHMYAPEKFVAGAGTVFEAIVGSLEGLFVPELMYRRSS